jgi:hypothetical protein
VTHPAPHLAPLLAFKINEMTPFLSAGDVADQSLRQAHALIIMLAAAFVESDETSNTNPHIVHDALEGIGSLIALASFATEGEQYLPEAAA